MTAEALAMMTADPSSLEMVRAVLSVEHPTQRVGVVSALHVDELMHAKWAVGPAVLDQTEVSGQFEGELRRMPYDEPFHAVFLEYVWLLSPLRSAASERSDNKQVRASIGKLLAHAELHTEHGRQLLEELDGLCAS